MKCLVTKLQGVVSDDSLVKFGEMLLDAKTDTTYAFLKSKAGRPITLSSIGGHIVVDGVNYETITIGEHGLGFLITPKTRLSLMPKYNVGVIQECMLPFNLDDLRYSELEQTSGLVILAFKGGDFGNIINSIKNASEARLSFYEGEYSNIEKISELKCTTLNIARYTEKVKVQISDVCKNQNMKSLMGYATSGNSKGPLVGDISSLANCAELTDISVAQSEGLYGNIESLSSLVKCKRFSLEVNYQIEGTLESLINGLKSNGASGEYYFDFTNTKVTYNGSSLTSPLTITL